MIPEYAATDAGEVAEREHVVEVTAPEAPPASAREIAPVAAAVQPTPRKNLIERVRDWLRRAA